MRIWSSECVSLGFVILSK